MSPQFTERKHRDDIYSSICCTILLRFAWNVEGNSRDYFLNIVIDLAIFRVDFSLLDYRMKSICL